jgi:hypothetical protein
LQSELIWDTFGRNLEAKVESAAEDAAIQSEQMPVDALRIVSIATFAYILANVLHDGVGHGGAFVVMGGNGCRSGEAGRGSSRPASWP